MNQKRKEAMEDNALSREEITTMFGVKETTPYLLNVADDPVLAGAMMFYIEEGSKMTVGKAPESEIRLKGIGISDTLCTIEHREGKLIYLEKCSAEGRVVVDGRPMEAEQVLQI